MIHRLSRGVIVLLVIGGRSWAVGDAEVLAMLGDPDIAASPSAVEGTRQKDGTWRATWMEGRDEGGYVVLGVGGELLELRRWGARYGDGRWLTPGEFKARGLELARKYIPDFTHAGEAEEMLSSVGSIRGGGAVVTVYVQKYRFKQLVLAADVGVEGWSGKMAYFKVYRFSIVGAAPGPEFEEAVAAGRKAIAARLNCNQGDIVVDRTLTHRWYNSETQHMEALVFGHQQGVPLPLYYTRVDEVSGACTRPAAPWPASHPYPHPKSPPCDKWPEWGPSGDIVWLSQRHWRGFPSWQDNVPRSLFMATAQGEVRCLRPVPEPHDDWPHGWYEGGSIGRDLLFYWYDENGWGIVGLREPALHIRGQWSRESKLGSFSPDEKHLVVCGARAGYDTDLFVIDLARPLGARGQWRPTGLLPGEDTCPVWSPQGDVIAFAHQDPEDRNKWSVMLTEWQENSTPRVVREGLKAIGRLSWFPEGERLLLYQAGDPRVGILNVNDGTLAPLELPELHDPDLPEGKPLIIQDPAVDPTGTKIAFSAVRWSGKPEDKAAQLIYVVNLDGTGLRRISPLDWETPIPLYEFPQAGAPAPQE